VEVIGPAPQYAARHLRHRDNGVPGRLDIRCLVLLGHAYVAMQTMNGVCPELGDDQRLDAERILDRLQEIACGLRDQVWHFGKVLRPLPAEKTEVQVGGDE